MDNPVTDYDITVSDQAIEDLQTVQALWTGLEPHADNSFFLSWHWIGTWLELIPDDCSPRLIVARQGGEAVGLAVLTSHKQKHRLFFSTNALSLNETALPGYNMVIEHNGFLMRRGLEREVAAEMLQYIYDRFTDHDELFLSAIRQDSPLFQAAVSGESFPMVRVLKESPSPYVDLQYLRDTKTDYLSTLSRNARYQLRRDLRAARQHGELQITEASSVKEALEYLDRMKPLHQHHWRRRGLPGSFANSRWERFHRELTKQAFPTGHIQFLKVQSGTRILGYLYNFLYAGRAYSLQSGFNYDITSNPRPGYISHYSGIEYNLSHAATAYDFLMGDGQYKRSLSTAKNILAWLILQRPRLKFRIENSMHSIYSNVMHGGQFDKRRNLMYQTHA